MTAAATLTFRDSICPPRDTIPSQARRTSGLSPPAFGAEDERDPAVRRSAFHSGAPPSEAAPQTQRSGPFTSFR